jgi:TrmH family RNA methyltransferase
LPTIWASSREAVDGAKAAGFRIVAVEDVGTVEPWDCDLTGNVLCIVGSEREGIPQWILDEADEIVRLPMAGFVPSYNLQVAVSVVAVEALRQRRT